MQVKMIFPIYFACRYIFSVELPYSRNLISFYGVGKKDNNIMYSVTDVLNNSKIVFLDKLPYRSDKKWKEYTPIIWQ